jgi:hypothetical protein
MYKQPNNHLLKKYNFRKSKSKIENCEHCKYFNHTDEDFTGTWYYQCKKIGKNKPDITQCNPSFICDLFEK